MKGLNNILLEGRVEDAQEYFEKAVGSWPVAEVQVTQRGLELVILI